MQASNSVWLVKNIIQDSQCNGVRLPPLWLLALESGAASGEVGETGTSNAGLGICRASRLHFFERALVWRGREVSPWELDVWLPLQPLENSDVGSEFNAGLVSGQEWAFWGFPWGHEVDRSGESAADSSRPLVPCVHCKGSARKRK